MAARLKETYKKQVAPALMKEFHYKNIMAVPQLKKIVVNMGVGEAIANAKILDVASAEVSAITGQKPVITRAKKSIASFKLRAGMPIGVSVTLRGDTMTVVILFLCTKRLTSSLSSKPFVNNVKDTLTYPQHSI